MLVQQLLMLVQAVQFILKQEVSYREIWVTLNKKRKHLKKCESFRRLLCILSSHCAFPLDAVLVPLLYQTDPLQHVCDVVDSSLLPDIEGVRGNLEVQDAILRLLEQVHKPWNKICKLEEGG